MKFRKRPVVIDATQWRWLGDHPEVVGYRAVAMYADEICAQCALMFKRHGWIDTLEGGHIVCPGDWIVTGEHGEHFSITEPLFEMLYELVDDEEVPTVPLFEDAGTIQCKVTRLCEYADLTDENNWLAFPDDTAFANSIIEEWLGDMIIEDDHKALSSWALAAVCEWWDQIRERRAR